MKRLMAMAMLLLMTGCTMFVKSPEVDLKAIRITGLDRSGLRMDLVLEVRNDNDRDLVLKGYRYDLQVQSLPVTRGEVTAKNEFPAHSATDVTVPVKLPYTALADLLQHQPDPERIPYTLSASFDVDTLFGSVAVPCKKSGTFAIPEKFRASSILNLLNGLLKK
jgi:LEA14-like dessication related protein